MQPILIACVTRRVAIVLITLVLLGWHASPVQAAATATFINTDSSTQGSWMGVYGSDGYDIVADPSSNNPSDPSYAATAVTGATTVVYSSSSADPRALQVALPGSTNRVAADYTSATSFSVDVNTTDGKPHQLALYMVDWDDSGRTQTVTLEDANSLAVLDTEPVASFSNGVYLIWRISGNVLITVTNTGTSPSAVLNGIFFDYPGSVSSSISVTPTSASVAEGDHETFTAIALDQNGNPMATQPAFTWTVSGGGTITSAGVFIAAEQTGGPYTVQATASGLTGQAIATVASTHTVTFGPGTSITVTGQNGAFVTDLDGDGHLDIIVPTSSGGLVFLFGNGNGTFTQVTYPYAVPNPGGQFAAGDLTGSGMTDLVYPTSGGVEVIMNQGSRTFAAPVYYSGASGASGVALGNFNEDGKLDVAEVGTVSGNNEMAILLNNGDGTFGTATQYSLPDPYDSYTTSIVALDVNSDGHLDLAASTLNEFATAVAWIYLGDGNGNFAPAPVPSVNVGGDSIFAADLNNDGILDLYNSDHWAGQPRWALGDGKGGFPEQYTQGGLGYAHSLSAADFDGDGYLDLIDGFDSNGNNYTGLYINNGDGTYPRPSTYNVGTTVGDFNEDGQPDAVNTNGSNSVAIYLNTTNPAPTITNLVPDGALVGGSQTLVVQGHGLLSRSVINWNGTPLPTTFNYQAGTLTASLTPTQLATTGAALVSVSTGSPGGGVSNSLDFYVGQAPTSIQISPSSATVEGSATQPFSATVLDQNGDAMPTQPVVAWKTAGLDNTIVTSGLFSAGNTPGSFSVTASYDGLTASAPINITDFSLSANPSAVSVQLNASGQSSISVTPLNGFNQFVSLTASGLPTGVIATFNPGSTETASTVTFTVGPNASFGTTPVTITGTVNGSSHTVTVNLAVVQTFTSIAVKPGPNVTLTGPATQQFTATALDQFGNPMETQPAFAWSVESGGVGSITVSGGLYHSGAASGSVTVRAKSGTVMGTSAVTVNALPVTVANEAAATLNPVPGTATNLSATGAYAGAGGANVLTYTWSSTGPAAVTYSVNGTHAAKNSVATFTQPGAYKLTVTIASPYSSTTSSVNVTVNQTVVSITVAPGPTVTLGPSLPQTQQFTATAYDQFGEAFSTPPALKWNLASGSVGSIGSSDGLYRSGTVAGSATVRAKSSNAVVGTSSVTVN